MTLGATRVGEVVRRAAPAWLVIGLALVGCGQPTPSDAPTVEPFASATPTANAGGLLTWVGVFGPRDSTAPGDLVLEIGNTAWNGYGGVVSVASDRVLLVRLVERRSCRVYAAFAAPAGSLWVIRFSSTGWVTVTPVDDIEAGPGLGERAPSGCP